MKTLLSLIYQSFLMNFREKIFYALALTHFLGIALCHVISEWTMQNMTEVLYDFGGFYLMLMSSLISIILSSKILDNADGSVEGVLALVQSRSVYLIGRFLGLCVSIMASTLIFLAIWQIFLLGNQLPGLNMPHLLVFFTLTVPSLLIAALSLLFSSFTQTTVTVMTSFILFGIGLMSQTLSRGLPANASVSQRYIVEFFAKFWNLQQYNLMDALHLSGNVSNNLLLWLWIYALNMMAIFITLTIFIFAKKDI